MRTFGIILAVLGVLGAIGAMMMDVSVETAYGTVNNIGLISQRQNYLIVSAVAVVVGALMAIFSGRHAVASAGVVDPFDEIEMATKADRKRYAIDLGVTRIEGIYLYAGEPRASLESAIAAAEHDQGIETHPDPTPDEIAAREVAERVAAAAADRVTYIIIGCFLAVSLGAVVLFLVNN